MLAKDQDQLMGKLVKKLKRENPDVEITKEMVLNALEKECDKERDLQKKNQQKIRELKTNTREFERNVIDRVIQPKIQGHSFISKAKFMAYMTKAYREEGRDVDKANLPGFKIKSAIFTAATNNFAIEGAPSIKYTSHNTKLSLYDEVAN